VSGVPVVRARSLMLNNTNSRRFTGFVIIVIGMLPIY